MFHFFFSSRRRHTRFDCDWSSDVCSSDLSLRSAGGIEAGLRHYEEVRSVEVLKIQNAARNSTEWFENVERYAGLEPEQFAYSLLTRSQRISHENLRLREIGRAHV